MRRLFAFLATVLVLGSSLAARANSNFDEIDPVGNELLGTLNVVSPSSAQVPAKFIMSYTLAAVGLTTKSVDADQPNRILGGDYCLRLSLRNTGPLSVLCGVKVVKKQTTTVRVSAVRFDWPMEKFKVDLGPTVNLAFEGDMQFKQEMDGVHPWMNADTSMYTPLLDTKITASVREFPVFRGQTVDVKQGDVEVHALAFPDLRSTLELAMPKRVYPEATGCQPVGAFVVHRSNLSAPRFHVPVNVLLNGSWNQSGRTGLLTYALLDDSETTARFFPSQDGVRPVLYELVVNNTFMPISKAQTSTMRIAVKRIDVNDVLVTRENGTTYYVKGTYRIHRKDPATSAYVPVEVTLGRAGQCNYLEAFSSLPTKTGVDVLPDEYKVTVDYKTEEGSDSKDYFLDLR